ncbi:4'-phosphopantetheinyl transferase EntD [Kitasatospora sp. MAP12-15]|uniref:4'-phosphopantetheinyl transferase family protein n=1 Tax=unclassified Kitasatospora TaxID=2633591 RepID=UPI002475B7D3|nr:4'-phosphopantetheinyl transferase superfamily protein [Kitasatospora sp. MAP12-44]MDH6114873.1 4'-phosphopantetheinyl transferase EntD [Kitasatospora sp. MAP12-44]
MIERILPFGVVSSESFGDPTEVRLYPKEALIVRNAVQSRRREFATGRWCARRSLAELGLPPGPLLADPRGAPRWPDSVVGSITHCVGYRAAAVARSERLSMLGIDAEPHAALPEGTLETVSLPEERVWIRQLQAVAPGTHWDRLLFSLKEAVYKAWSPVTIRPLGFEDARITVDPATSTFTAHLLVPSPLRRHGRPLHQLRGRWLISGGLVLSAIAEPADTPAPN